MDEGQAAGSGSLGGITVALESGLSAGLLDRDLLARFAGGGEGADAAFAVLVDRHGPLVWRVCQRVAGDAADAADAFQATWLVLIRRARGVRVGDSLGPWLRGVAIRVAQRARGRALRDRRRERSNHETALAAMPARHPATPEFDLRLVLDQELARLPRAYRRALEACYRDGLTHQAAATALGCPVGTVRSRLSRGRDLLRSRLARRGLGPVADGALALAVDPTLLATPLPPGLLDATVRLSRSVDRARPRVVALAGTVAQALAGGRLARTVAPLAGVLLVAGAVWAVARPQPVAPLPPPDDPAAPLPAVSAEALALQVRAAIAQPRIGLIAAEFQDEQLDREAEVSLRMHLVPFPPGLEPPPDDAARRLAEPKPIVYDRAPGRFTYRTDGQRWRTEHDGSYLGFRVAPGTYTSDQWAAGFDGVVHYEARDRGQTVELGTIKVEAEAERPASLFWDGAGAQPPPTEASPGQAFTTRVHHGFSSPVTTTDASPLDVALGAGAAVNQRTVDGFRCYALTRADPDRPDTVVEAVVSPRQSHLPLAVRKLSRGRVTHSFAASEARRLPDGQWYPGRIVVADWILPAEAEAGAPPTLKSRRDLRVVRCEPLGGPGAPAPGDLNLVIPPGSKILDRRLGQSYLDDPWWPEIHRWLTDQGWPDLDPSPLGALRSPQGDLAGRAAPPLLVAEWLAGPAVDPDLRDRAATLLVFPIPGDPTLAPALSRLGALVGADRLRIVTVVPRVAGRTAEAERAFLREFRWPGSVAWDAPQPRDYGPTSAAYGLDDVRDLPAAYLVTPDGQVRTVAPRGCFVALAEVLAAPEQAPLTFPEPTEEIGLGRRWFALVRAWRAWTATAPATHRLGGTIRNAEGHPIAGAQVRLNLFAEVASRIDYQATGGWTTLRLTGTVERATQTDDSGRWAVDRLPKGKYTVGVVAPGHATTEAVSIIPEGQAAVDHPLTLPGDSILGTIRAADGGPVAGALIEVFNRHTRAANGGTNYGLDGFLARKQTATADAAGRYRCGPLVDGLYSVRVTAPGWVEEIRTDLAVGVGSVDFALVRSPDQVAAPPERP